MSASSAATSNRHDPGHEPPSRRLGAGVFLLSLGLILYELCLTRVLSVLYYYHTAFLAIAIAMLGLAVGGLWVQLAPRVIRGRAGLVLVVTGLSMAALPPLFPTVYLELSQLEDFLGARFVFSFAITTVVCLVPFVGGGAVLASIFAANGDRIGRLYSADLLGAAAGALLLIPVMAAVGGPGAMAACGAIVAVSALLLGSRRTPAVVAILLLCTVAALEATRNVFPIRVDVGTDEVAAVARPSFEKWNAFSRVVVLDDMGWDRGLSERRMDELRGKLPPQKEALIDINAYAPMIAFDGDLHTVRHLADLVSNAGHHVVGRGRDVAIIGPGCGKDVVGALLFAPASVVGIEINPILVNDLVLGAYRDFTGDVYRHPDVRIVIGDGRSELERMDRRFDLIVANSVATWSAHSAGAMNLSEQSLFTDRALALYRERLEDDGILSVSLWDETGHALPLRLLSTWRATLDASGRDELGGSVAVLGNLWEGERWFTTVLLARSPFGAERIAAINDFADEHAFEPLYIPGRKGAHPNFTAYLDAPDRFTRDFAFDIAPATDDRPFFFYTLRLADALRLEDLMRRSDNVAFVSLVVSFALIVAIVAFTLAAPLFWVSRIRRAPVSMSMREMLYFAALGAGFMFVEIPVIQRLTVFLGHPTYSLTVGLFGILAWSGLGSRLVDRSTNRAFGSREVRVVLVALVGVLVATWWWLPDPSHGGGGTSSRIALAFVLLCPLGVLMGIPMPSGLAAVGNRPGLAIPWAWAVNGAFGVLASVSAILIAVLFGYSAAYGSGCACYVVALLTWRGANPAPPSSGGGSAP